MNKYDFYKILFISRIFIFVDDELEFNLVTGEDAQMYYEHIKILQKCIRNFCAANFLQLASATKLDMSTPIVDEVYKHFPFQKNYSTRVGCILRFCMFQWLLHKKMVELKDRYADSYKQMITLERLQRNFRFKFNFVEALQKA